MNSQAIQDRAPHSAEVAPAPAQAAPPRPRHRGLLDPQIVRQAVLEAFVKLDPRKMIHAPVMFVVYLGSIWATVLFLRDAPHAGVSENLFAGLVILFLWFTVLFANFAEAMAEGRGKAQADSLRRMRKDTVARVLQKDGSAVERPSAALHIGERCLVDAGQLIPGDGEVVEGLALVDESAITGESAPVIRESGGDRSAVTGGTKVLSDSIIVEITAEPGATFLDRMIALVEGADRRKTPNEIALTVILVSLTMVFLVAVATLQPFAIYSHAHQPIMLLIALLVCLAPTTIGALLSSIGIAGMDRMIQRNVLATSGRAVEAAGDVDTLLLDKTGTITLGDRQATAFLPMPGVSETEVADAAQLASLADETPEGRSIVVLAKSFGFRGRDLDPTQTNFIEFTARTRMSGVDLDGHSVRKGAADAVRRWVEERDGEIPAEFESTVAQVSTEGGTPLAVARDGRMLGVVYLKDVVKGGIREKFSEMRALGIRTVMVTGDNPLTAAAIAQEAGVDEYMAEATPEDKMNRIRAEQAAGHLVAMTGDGTNDAPALALADVGVAMNTGTQAAKEAGNMVDLDSDPTKLMDVVEVGKQLLITRGSLTTFSICNDIAKYFVVIPGMFYSVYPQLTKIDVLHLSGPHAAILSAVIFNAIIILFLIPLALRGVRVKAMNATHQLRRNLLIYGLGGLITPFVLIKLIDVLVIAHLGVH